MFNFDEPGEGSLIAQQLKDSLDQAITTQHRTIHPFVYEELTDPAILDAWRGTTSEFIECVFHSSLFAEQLSIERRFFDRGDTTRFFGEIQEVSSPDKTGSIKQTEPVINVDFLVERGIDPTKVLFFRRTHISKDPKIERYWSSDFDAVRRGLIVERRGESRRNNVILVTTLALLNSNGGLIADGNDDNGLSVRCLGQELFNSDSALALIPA